MIKVSKQRTILAETKESNHVMKNARFYFVNLTEEKKGHQRQQLQQRR